MCGIAEEKLHERLEEEKEECEEDGAGTNLGVDGFGNLAFAVKSKRVLRVSETGTK